MDIFIIHRKELQARVDLDLGKIDSAGNGGVALGERGKEIGKLLGLLGGADGASKVARIKIDGFVAHHFLNISPVAEKPFLGLFFCEVISHQEAKEIAMVLRLDDFRLVEEGD